MLIFFSGGLGPDPGSNMGGGMGPDPIRPGGGGGGGIIRDPNPDVSGNQPGFVRPDVSGQRPPPIPMAPTNIPPPPGAPGGNRVPVYTPPTPSPPKQPPPGTFSQPLTRLADICKNGKGDRIIADPNNCARYYNCSRFAQRIKGLGPNHHECPYPQLMSTDTGYCEDFPIVNCGGRYEPKSPCEDLIFLKNFMFSIIFTITEIN